MRMWNISDVLQMCWKHYQWFIIFLLKQIYASVDLSYKTPMNFAVYSAQQGYTDWTATLHEHFVHLIMAYQINQFENGS